MALEEKTPAPSYLGAVLQDGYNVPKSLSLFPAWLGAAAAPIAVLLAAYGLRRWFGLALPLDAVLYIAAGSAFVGFFGTAFLTWFFVMRILKRAADADLNRNGIPDQFERKTITHRLVVNSLNDGGSPVMDILDLPEGILFEQFQTFCRGIVAGRSLAEDTWTGRGGLWSKPLYKTLREELLARGWIRKKSEKGRGESQGFEMTRAGRAVFEHYANNS